jgi:3-hydroxyacyl-[acyl-carrier-protein] dehydratase
MMDINEIREYLPHRYPFLLVDRRDLDEKQAHSRLQECQHQRAVLQWPLPAHPIMPGVLIIEAMAQAAGILGFKMLDSSRRWHPVLLRRFRQTAFPSASTAGRPVDRWRSSAARRQIWKFECQASVDGKPVCSAEIICAERV